MRFWFWLPQLGYGIFIWTYNEAVKLRVRQYPTGFAARKIAW